MTHIDDVKAGYVDPKVKKLIAELREVEGVGGDSASLGRGKDLLARHLNARDAGELPFWGERRPRRSAKLAQSRIGAGVAVKNQRFEGGNSSVALRRWVGYATVAGLAMAFAGWQLLESNNTPKSDSYTTYTTQAGQRASLTLRDGSRLTLGPATTLRVNNGTRQETVVDVTGEAMFTVAHAKERPFTVTSHGVTTRVLGTEFVVRAFDPSQIRVAVREGKVSVQSPVFTSSNATVVTVGEAASLTPNALPLVTPITDLATDFAWANGDLVLSNVPLGEAFIRLSRWYGKEFRVANESLLRRRVTGSFPGGFNTSEIQGLATVIGAHITVSRNVITFTSTE